MSNRPAKLRNAKRFEITPDIKRATSKVVAFFWDAHKRRHVSQFACGQLFVHDF